MPLYLASTMKKSSSSGSSFPRAPRNSPIKFSGFLFYIFNSYWFRSSFMWALFRPGKPLCRLKRLFYSLKRSYLGFLSMLRLLRLRVPGKAFVDFTCGKLIAFVFWADNSEFSLWLSNRAIFSFILLWSHCLFFKVYGVRQVASESSWQLHK